MIITSYIQQNTTLILIKISKLLHGKLPSVMLSAIIAQRYFAISYTKMSKSKQIQQGDNL